MPTLALYEILPVYDMQLRGKHLMAILFPWLGKLAVKAEIEMEIPVRFRYEHSPKKGFRAGDESPAVRQAVVRPKTVPCENGKR